jgi:hypothetical protein
MMRAAFALRKQQKRGALHQANAPPAVIHSRQAVNACNETITSPAQSRWRPPRSSVLPRSA